MSSKSVPLHQFQRKKGVSSRFPDFSLEHATALATAHRLSMLLHLIADLHAGIEVLRRAAVEADAFALVELALAVVGGDALLLAHVLKTIARQC